jgi:creatinine amidohydrolase
MKIGFDYSVFGSGTSDARRVLWQEQWRQELESMAAGAPVVIVPTGSVEQHGPHLTLDVDIVNAFALSVAAALEVRSFPVLVAPPIWTGISHYKQGHVGTISVRMETYTEVIADVCRSIHGNGFERIVLLNGHGGNRAVNQAISIKLAEEDIFFLPITYWDMVGDLLDEVSDRDDGSIGHAGEWETSLQLFLRPELVASDRARADDERQDLSVNVRRYTGFAERRRERAGGVHGDPTVATAEKGRLLFDAARDELIKVLHELHALPVRHYREFEEELKR